MVRSAVGKALYIRRIARTYRGEVVYLYVFFLTLFPPSHFNMVLAGKSEIPFQKQALFPVEHAGFNTTRDDGKQLRIRKDFFGCLGLRSPMITDPSLRPAL